jgi:hypothetical protein
MIPRISSVAIDGGRWPFRINIADVVQSLARENGRIVVRIEIS